MKTLFELYSSLRFKFFLDQNSPKVIAINNKYSNPSAQKIITTMSFYTDTQWKTNAYLDHLWRIIIRKHRTSIARHGKSIYLVLKIKSVGWTMRLRLICIFLAKWKSHNFGQKAADQIWKLEHIMHAWDLPLISINKIAKGLFLAQTWVISEEHWAVV